MEKKKETKTYCNYHDTQYCNMAQLMWFIHVAVIRKLFVIGSVIIIQLQSILCASRNETLVISAERLCLSVPTISLCWWNISRTELQCCIEQAAKSTLQLALKHKKCEVVVYHLTEMCVLEISQLSIFISKRYIITPITNIASENHANVNMRRG